MARDRERDDAAAGVALVAPPRTELVFFQSEDGLARLQVQIYEDGELEPGPTIRRYRIVRTEGKRSTSREVEHYALPAILAVGYRVRSHRGTQFR